MAWLVQLSSVLGLSLASGINLYATVAVVGLVTRFELVKGLPAEFQAFNNDVVIGVAIVLYLCEFLADKIPAFDSVWDSIHTFIRPFGAALIAVTVVGDATPVVEVLAGLVGASLGLATHTAKAGVRLVANTSPEPFSNAILSTGEDVAVAGLSILTLSHPYVSLAVSALILVLLIRFGPGLARSALLVLKAVPAKLLVPLADRDAATRAIALPDAIEEAVDDVLDEDESVRIGERCHAGKVPGCGRNKTGWLVLTDRRLIFACRRPFATKIRQWELTDLTKPGLNRRFLVDVMRVKHEGRFLNFVFLKHRAASTERLCAALASDVGRELAPPGDSPGVVPLPAGGRS